jgi:hypothetical protein
VATIVMPFGKHKGRPLDAMPTDYLRWLVNLPNLRPAMRWAVVEELAQERDCCRSSYLLEDACRAYLDDLAAGERKVTTHIVECRRPGEPWREHSRHEGMDAGEWAADEMSFAPALQGLERRIRRESRMEKIPAAEVPS